MAYEAQQICLHSENIQEAPAAEVDKQISPPSTLTGYQPQPCTPKGYEPQLITPQGKKISEEASQALEDMVELFLTERRCASVNGAYELLPDRTRQYLRWLSFGCDRAMPLCSRRGFQKTLLLSLSICSVVIYAYTFYICMHISKNNHKQKIYIY